MKWKQQFEKLKKPISVCKNCFKDSQLGSFHKLLNQDFHVCDRCMYDSKPQFISYKINGIKALSIFSYNDYMRSKIFQYKGCEDYELKDFFLTPYKIELLTIFGGYTMVPIPSFIEDDNKRGYNHVVEVFSTLGLEISKCLIKTKNIKQKELSFADRQKIGNIIEFDKKFDIKNKKVLLVDDIVTTGASMKAAVALMKKAGVKKIRILTIAKRVLSDEELSIMENVKRI